MLRQGLVRCFAAGMLLLVTAAAAYANDANKTLKIGVIYDLTGPFAGGGSELHYLGAKTMIDWFIQKGPIEGYKIEAVYADGQSKPDVVINEAGAKEGGLNIVLDEGYSATAPDLSSLVTKLKRARPDVIFHTGYNPDISLFLRQARELGLRFSALIGHGAGYTDYTRIKQAVGTDANYFFDVDPISIWDTNPKYLKPELVPMIQMVGDAYLKAKPETIIKSPHVGMAASNTYLFLADVLPRAIKKYGGVNADALSKAARETDVPDGGTMLGFGVKFEPEEAAMAGQNMRAFPVVIQYIDDKAYVVWPKSQQQREPELKLPASSPYAVQ